MMDRTTASTLASAGLCEAIQSYCVKLSKDADTLTEDDFNSTDFNYFLETAPSINPLFVELGRNLAESDSPICWVIPLPGSQSALRVLRHRTFFDLDLCREEAGAREAVECEPFELPAGTVLRVCDVQDTDIAAGHADYLSRCTPAVGSVSVRRRL